MIYLTEEELQRVASRAKAKTTGVLKMGRSLEPEPLDVTSDNTFARWLALPETDLRTLEEFAAQPELVVAIGSNTRYE